MTHFLSNKSNPDGYKLEDLLDAVRTDLVERMSLIARDRRPEARKVFENDVAILDCLTQALAKAEENSHILNRSFGPSKKGAARIGQSA